MKQLNFFSASSAHSTDSLTLCIDGAARNNPGPAGAGVYITHGEKVVLKKGFFLGNKTNNQAEYSALLLGLAYVREHLVDLGDVCIKSDSQLLVRQLLKEYRVKDPQLQILYRRAVELLEGMSYCVCHIPREENSIADSLANEGIDKKHSVPEKFLALLS